MKILVDENNYVISYALIGDFIDSIEVDDPEDTEYFEANFEAFKLNSGELLYDENRAAKLERQRLIEDLKSRRERECFSIINRGKAWYDTLTEEQYEELQVWYQAWLNVTTTLVVPDKPSWLN